MLLSRLKYSCGSIKFLMFCADDIPLRTRRRIQTQDCHLWPICSSSSSYNAITRAIQSVPRSLLNQSSILRDYLAPIISFRRLDYNLVSRRSHHNYNQSRPKFSTMKSRLPLSVLALGVSFHLASRHLIQRSKPELSSATNRHHDSFLQTKFVT